MKGWLLEPSFQYLTAITIYLVINIPFSRNNNWNPLVNFLIYSNYFTNTLMILYLLETNEIPPAGISSGDITPTGVGGNRKNDGIESDELSAIRMVALLGYPGNGLRELIAKPVSMAGFFYSST